MKIKTTELTGAALDWAVARCEGRQEPELMDNFVVAWYTWGNAHYSTDWAIGGPIIERKRLTVMYDDDWKFDPTDPEDNGERWMANTNDVYYEPTAYGPTPLIAAMRCHVASEMGDEIEIPKELTP